MKATSGTDGGGNMRRGLWPLLVQCLIAMNVGFLGAASCIALARRVDRDGYDRFFGLARWVSEALGEALGWDAHRTSHALTFGVQQFVVGLALAACTLVVVSWARSRWLSDRSLCLLGALVGVVAPWMSLLLVAGALPRETQDFVAYGAIIVALSLSIQGVRLLEKKRWAQNKPGVVAGSLAILLLWIALVSLMSGLEWTTVWGSFIVSLCVIAASARWYLQQSDQMTAPAAASPAPSRSS